MKALLSGIVLGLLIALGGSLVFRRELQPVTAPAAMKSPAAPASPLSAEESAQLAEVMARVQRDYVDEVEHPELIDDALRGLVHGLDPYSTYLDSEEYADLKVSTAGSYAGIGIEVSTADRALRVVRPFRDSPAAVAGIQSGDLIAAIDGTPVGADLDAAMARMRGPRGTTVKLSVMRVGQTLPLEFTVQRARVDVHSVVAVPVEDAFGYVRISTFSDTTNADFITAVTRLRRVLDRKPRGLIIDLRHNPGGVLEAAVDVADQLLESGVIVTADGRSPAARFTLQATPGELLPGVPIVLLVDGATASAAEILAGALQDHGRALLLGRRTFGKGSVQTVMPLSGGRAIKLTTSRYHTPSGRSIQGSGIQPDQIFEQIDSLPPDLDDEQVWRALPSHDPAVQAALDLLKGRKPRGHHPSDAGLTAMAPAWK